MALRCKKYGSTGGARDWGDLPCDIIVSIFEHLVDYRVDLRRAASVCVAWRRAGSLLNFNKPSIINLPFICTCRAYNGNANYCFCCQNNFELRTCPLYFFISPGLNRFETRVWLFRAEEIETNKWLLGRRPPSSLGLEYNFNLLDEHKILDVAKVYYLYNRRRVRKVISTSDLGMFLILFDDKGKLALWSEDSHQWSYILDTRNYEFDDIINFRDQLYAIDIKGRLVMINPITHDLVEVASSPKGIIKYDVTVMYLVCSDGFLYLVYKGFGRSRPCEIGEPKDVGVFLFDKQNRVWVRVENLRNKLFFITKYANFSLTPKQIGWSHGNYICFMREDFPFVEHFGQTPIIYKVEGNVCRKKEDFHSDIIVHFGGPPEWICPMQHSSKKRKSRKSKRKKGRKGK